MSRNPGRPWGRRVVVAGALVLGLAANAVAGVRIGETELYVNYIGTNTVQVTVNGTIIRSGGTIPAGAYTVIVAVNGYNDSPRFLMSGPSVNVNDDLNPGGMGVPGVVTFGPYTFPANATYTVQQQGGAPVSFSTPAAAGGSSGGSTGGSSSGGSSGTSVSSPGSSGGKTGSSSSGTAKTAGTLAGSVSAAGKGTLTFGGKAPK